MESLPVSFTIQGVSEWLQSLYNGGMREDHRIDKNNSRNQTAITGGEFERDCAAHTVTHDNRPWKPQFATQICQVLGKAGDCIFLLGRVACAVSPEVNRNDAIGAA